MGRVDCSRPFALQGTRPGYVTELYRALTVPIDKPPPAPVGTAPTPHPRAGDLRLEPASCEFDAEVALQFEAASQGRDVEEQAQAVEADTEGEGSGVSAQSLWRAFTLTQPGEPLDHLDHLMGGASCAVVTSSPFPASDASPRWVPSSPATPTNMTKVGAFFF